ncbi:MAG: GNAT family N-acetyltransferase [Rhizomicrobium sp.]
MRQVESLGGRTLTGRFISLEPLEQRHIPALAEAGRDSSIWTYMPHDVTNGVGAMLEGIASENASGRMISYAVRRLLDGALLGSTSYLNIVPEHARVEIGATWYAPEAQATAVNPEAKYLLFGRAFSAHYNRVELKTDSKNARSRAAMTKMGAKEEGTLRGHMWVPQGYFRDTVYFSILASEWPAVKATFEARLSAFG